jgi:hypothetical protein
MHGCGKRWIHFHNLLGCQLRAGRGDSLIKGRLCVSLSDSVRTACIANGLQCMQLCRCDADVKWVASCLGCSPSALVFA